MSHGIVGRQERLGGIHFSFPGDDDWDSTFLQDVDMFTATRRYNPEDESLQR
jgi:hypothetical protein